MVDFDVRSKIIEVHSKDKHEPCYVHDHILRQHFGEYGLMIDKAIKTTGKASIQLNLSSAALVELVDWFYGTPILFALDTTNATTVIAFPSTLRSFSRHSWHPCSIRHAW
jgi:hypothetical protein